MWRHTSERTWHKTRRSLSLILTSREPSLTSLRLFLKWTKKFQFFFCHDPDGFIEKECEILGRSPDDFDKKLGIDSGKGSNKLTLTLREKEQYQIPRKKSRVTHKDSVQVGVNK